MVKSASLQELSGKIRGGEIRSEDVMASAYDRIKTHDSDLNVFRSRLDRETALKKAREIDHRDLHYPLRRQRQMCIRDRFFFLI